MNKVALLDSINSAASNIFAEVDFEVSQFPKTLDADGLAELATENRAIGVRSGPALPSEVFLSATALEAVGCYCVGTNHVDLTAASEAGVAVFNSMHENTRSVAEHVIGAAFSLLKRTGEHNRALHNGIWTKTEERTYELRGKTMGIVGYGSIGAQVGMMAESLGMEVKYFDPSPRTPSYSRAERKASLGELLSESDIVTLHVPGGPTKNLIDAIAIASMRPGSFLINTARGDVVDYEAAAAALDSGQLAGIALDVFVDEPGRAGDAFEHILRGHPNALLTPHTAGSTIEAQSEIGLKTSLKLLSHLATGSTVDSVNLPVLALGPVDEGITRILYQHRNVPGAMTELSDLIADAKINVARSVLETKKQYGYSSIDVEGDLSDDIVTTAADLPAAIRIRTVR